MLHTSVRSASGAASLAPEQRFLLWAIRAWTARGGPASRPRSRCRHAFDSLGLRGAAEAMDEAPSALARASCRRFAVHAPQYCALSEDEEIMLPVAAAAQHHRYDDASVLLGGMVDAQAATELLGRLGSFGVLMALGGLIIPDPGADAATASAGSAAPVALH